MNSCRTRLDFQSNLGSWEAQGSNLLPPAYFCCPFPGHWSLSVLLMPSLASVTCLSTLLLPLSPNYFLLLLLLSFHSSSQFFLLPFSLFSLPHLSLHPLLLLHDKPFGLFQVVFSDEKKIRQPTDMNTAACLSVTVSFNSAYFFNYKNNTCL